MKACNDITFLSNYWAEAKRIGQKVIEELPQINEVSESKKNSLQFVQFKDIKNSWSPSDLLTDGRSKSLEVLAKKIDDMISRGRAKDIEIMLRSIITGKIKVWHAGTYNKGKRNKRREKKQNYEIMQFHYTSDDKYCTGEEQEFMHGHFRWNHGGHILTNQEIKHVKKYFQL